MGEFRGLLPDGGLPSRAMQQVEEIVEGMDLAIDGDIPIFATLAEAEAWEEKNPGRTALTLEPSTPPDPSQWVPKVPTMSIETRSYTIPSDAGATYTIDGVTVTAGTYAVPGAATLAWTAKPRAGYTFKAGSTTSGTWEFPEKTYKSGDVLLSDSFTRATDGTLVGSLTDSYAGGKATAWETAPGRVAVNGRHVTAGGVAKHDAANQHDGFAYVPLPILAPSITLEFVPIAESGAALMEISLYGETESIFQSITTVGAALPGGTAVSQGDVVRYEYNGTTATMTNVTTGATVPPASVKKITGPVRGIRIASSFASPGALGEIKVVHG